MYLMNNAANDKRGYTVEGHGLGTLIVEGKGSRFGSWNDRRPRYTREQAWEAVQRFRARGDLHTIKVYREGQHDKPVWYEYLTAK